MAFDGDEPYEGNGLRVHRARPLSAVYAEVKRLDQLAAAEARRVAAEIALLEVENDGQVALANERWVGHKESHVELARALERSQAAANEWRGSLADLRNTFVTKVEWNAEHRALIGRMEAQEKSSNAASTETKTVRGLFGDLRNLLLLVIGLVTAAVVLITLFKG